MFHEIIKSLFLDAIDSVVAEISNYAVNPDCDFTRNKKLPIKNSLIFWSRRSLLLQKISFLTFFGLDTDMPIASAFNWQRAKLKPEAVEAVFNKFNASAIQTVETPKYRFIAANGSSIFYLSNPKFSPSEYFVEPCHSAKGYYSMHINAFLIWTDICIQAQF